MQGVAGQPQVQQCIVNLCPNSPIHKPAPGWCGCDLPDIDTDGDGFPDCADSCNHDPLKIDPGSCGCGNLDTDSDDDGTPDCHDLCPADPQSVTSPDADGDGTPDCIDKCPINSEKVNPDACLCERGSDLGNRDGDNLPNCIDLCPDNKYLYAPVGGSCEGWGILCTIPPTDTDRDGVADCRDVCYQDSKKIEPGACGCFRVDEDKNGNGTVDCLEVTSNEQRQSPSPVVRKKGKTVTFMLTGAKAKIEIAGVGKVKSFKRSHRAAKDKFKIKKHPTGTYKVRQKAAGYALWSPWIRYSVRP